MSRPPIGLTPGRWLVTVFLALLAITSLQADERILSYHADIEIESGGEMQVTETIDARSAGQQIRRGIYRDFPTDYRDRWGNAYRVDFEVLSVQRNGQNEAWHTESLSNGVRLYIGSADRLLSHGEHRFTIRYRTNRQIGYFDDNDQLWWNVTGNGWDFVIDSASASLHLPFVVDPDVLELDAWVGSYGSTDRSVSIDTPTPERVRFQSRRALAPSEGLTILVAWPKGLIAEPSATQRIRWFLADNGAALALGSGLLLALLWYLWAWNRVGRDPAKGVIIPRFKPPEGLSPAAVRYVSDMAFSRHTFTAALISLAVKGRLVIEDQDDEFTLRRGLREDGPALTAGEQAVLQSLLPGKARSIVMEQENHQAFREARSALESALKKEYQNRLFRINGIYLLPPWLLTLLAAGAALLLRGGPVIWVAFVILGLSLHLLFAWLMRAPTPAGRIVMDEIEGLREYLGTAEQERLDRMRSPTLTPEVFEFFLPYAFALGVQNRWCERFARELPQDAGERSYQPAWYHGNLHGMNSLGRLGNDFSSSFSSAVSSASTPPGSSSGSGGGGFSGGGGGGGGGGGW